MTEQDYFLYIKTQAVSALRSNEYNLRRTQQETGVPRTLLRTWLEELDEHKDYVGREFIRYFTAMSEQFEDNAIKKGFWADNPTVGEKIALMHQELSELLETYRSDSKPSEKIPEFSEAEEEIADLIIRAADFGFHHGHRVAEAIVAKHAYNTGRPYKHGKKF